MVPGVPNVLELLGLHDIFIGFVHRDGVTMRGIEPIRLASSIVIDLYEIAACYGLFVNIPFAHLGDVDAILVNCDSIRKSIGAAIVAIDNEVNYLAPRSPS